MGITRFTSMMNPTKKMKMISLFNHDFVHVFFRTRTLFNEHHLSRMCSVCMAAVRVIEINRTKNFIFCENSPIDYRRILLLFPFYKAGIKTTNEKTDE